MKTIQILSIAALALAVAACAPPTASGGGGGGGGNNPPGPSNHDGSYASPVQLTVGDEFSGKIGADDTADQVSYYRFNTGSDTDFELILTDDSVGHPINGIMTQLSVSLYDDNESNSSGDQIGFILAEGLRPVFDDLTTNKNYTITVAAASGQEAGTYKLKVVTHSNPNEGNSTTGEALTLGITHQGTASNAEGESYFEFQTAVDNTSVTFDYDVHGLSLVLYSSSDFGAGLTGFVSSNNNVSNGSWTVTGLTANTPYYLTLRPGAGMGALGALSVDYHLTVSVAATE